MPSFSLEGHNLPPLGGPGMNEEVVALAACYVAGGVDADPTELMVATGAAFSTYFFAPSLNPNVTIGPDPDNERAPWCRRYGWSSLRYTNYGHLESAAYWHGGEVRSLLAFDRTQTAKILRFELEAGRPIIWLDLDPVDVVVPGDPDEVNGHGRTVREPNAAAQSHVRLVYSLTVETRPLTVTVHLTDGSERHVGKHDRSTMILVRPGPVPDHRPDDTARLADVFAWADAHARKHKELVYETARFYASGLAAIEAAAHFVEATAPLELASPVGSTPETVAEDLARFLSATLNQWHDRRHAAASWFGRKDRPEVAAAFAAAAEGFATVPRLSAHEIGQDAKRREVAESLRSVVEQDARALRLLVH